MFRPYGTSAKKKQSVSAYLFLDASGSIRVGVSLAPRKIARLLNLPYQEKEETKSSTHYDAGPFSGYQGVMSTIASLVDVASTRVEGIPATLKTLIQ